MLKFYYINGDITPYINDGSILCKVITVDYGRANFERKIVINPDEDELLFLKLRMTRVVELSVNHLPNHRLSVEFPNINGVFCRAPTEIISVIVKYCAAENLL